MPDAKKEHIHSINYNILNIVEESYGIEPPELTSESLAELKSILSSFQIDYGKLRKVLDPCNDAYSFMFNCDEIQSVVYGGVINNLIFNELEEKCNCIFLAGDVSNNINRYFILESLFQENGCDTRVILDHNLYNVVVVGISNHAFNNILTKLKNEKSFLFGTNITTPNVIKHFLTYNMIQLFIKYGKKLIYPTPEPNDSANYTTILNANYTKCPILDFYYYIFLQNNLIQFAAPFADLVSSIKAISNTEILDYPKVEISQAKYDYIKKEKQFKYSKSILKKTITNSIKQNQIFHLAKSDENEPDCIDLNVQSTINGKTYHVALEWNLKFNKVSLITVTR